MNKPRSEFEDRDLCRAKRTTKLALIVAAALLPLMIARPARAQSFSVLYSFTNAPDGSLSYSALVADPAGNLYGTTYEGGTYGAFGNGTIFELPASGGENVLYSFTGGADGGGPLAGLVGDAAGNLYGTTNYGGDSGTCQEVTCGVIFKLSPQGQETVLHKFSGGDGANPFAGLIKDSQGNLYGTTTYGGDSVCNPYGCGVVFKIDPTGNETVLHRFSGAPDGRTPYAALARDSAGNLYGTTNEGGAGSCPLGCGTVFKIDTAGNETVLYSFTGLADGGYPEGALVLDASGNLYGTAAAGGNNNLCGSGSGCGVVFKLDSSGKETVLYAFRDGADGGAPLAGLVRDPEGNLFGSTNTGGLLNSICRGIGCGVVFKVSPSGKETVLHTFDYSDGQYPDASLLFHDHFLYGTTIEGGSYSGGVVFKVLP